MIKTKERKIKTILLQVLDKFYSNLSYYTRNYQNPPIPTNPVSYNDPSGRRTTIRVVFFHFHFYLVYVPNVPFNNSNRYASRTITEPGSGVTKAIMICIRKSTEKNLPALHKDLILIHKQQRSHRHAIVVLSQVLTDGCKTIQPLDAAAVRKILQSTLEDGVARQ